jgi:hypothetical protein
MKRLYCAVSRVRHTHDFQWLRFEATTPEEYMTCVDVGRLGGLAPLVEYAQSLAIGLPETFSAKDRGGLVDEVEDLAAGKGRAAAWTTRPKY